MKALLRVAVNGRPVMRHRLPPSPQIRLPQLGWIHGGRLAVCLRIT
jgi:hypothetical protein